ncbi:hypothetical protein FHG87_002026 [Trinorchestia longiramus]|nr:hypothetical protein FHG87_002026 [Trinorchestia longiramus]
MDSHPKDESKNSSCQLSKQIVADLAEAMAEPESNERNESSVSSLNVGANSTAALDESADDKRAPEHYFKTHAELVETIAAASEPLLNAPDVHVESHSSSDIEDFEVIDLPVSEDEGGKRELDSLLSNVAPKETLNPPNVLKQGLTKPGSDPAKKIGSRLSAKFSREPSLVGATSKKPGSANSETKTLKNEPSVTQSEPTTSKDASPLNSCEVKMAKNTRVVFPDDKFPVKPRDPSIACLGAAMISEQEGPESRDAAMITEQEGTESLDASVISESESHKSSDISVISEPEGHESSDIPVISQLEGHKGSRILVTSELEGHESSRIPVISELEGHESSDISVISEPGDHASSDIPVISEPEGHASSGIPVISEPEGYESSDISVISEQETHESSDISVISETKGHKSLRLLVTSVLEGHESSRIPVISEIGHESSDISVISEPEGHESSNTSVVPKQEGPASSDVTIIPKQEDPASSDATETAEQEGPSSFPVSMSQKQSLGSSCETKIEDLGQATFTAKKSLQYPAVIRTPLGFISKRGKDSSFKFSLEIPFYKNEDAQQHVLLGFIDLSEPFYDYGTCHDLSLEGMAAHYANFGSEEQMRNKFRLCRLHNTPRSNSAKPQPRVKLANDRPCHECKQSQRVDMVKLIDKFDPLSCSNVTRPAFNYEHSFLFLFRISELCYPFCVECDTASPKFLSISIDNVDYSFSGGSAMCEPSTESLSVTAYYHGQVSRATVPDFDIEKLILLTLGEKMYKVELTCAKFHLKDSNYGKTNCVQGEGFFRVDGQPSTLYFKLKRGNELPVKKTGSVFQKDRWSYGDTVKAKACTGLLEKESSEVKEVDLKIGQSGTLVLQSPATVVEWSAARVLYRVSACAERLRAGSKPGNEYELFLVSRRELALIVLDLIHQPANSCANQPANSCTNQPANSCTNQPANTCTNQPANSCTNQPANGCANQPTYQPIYL